jgi:ribosomal protein L37AE/L43A
MAVSSVEESIRSDVGAGNKGAESGERRKAAMSRRFGYRQGSTLKAASRRRLVRHGGVSGPLQPHSAQHITADQRTEIVHEYFKVERRRSQPMAIYKYVCSNCGSENVRRDAWATWDVETQSWELAVVFQAGFYDDCDDVASLDAIEIDRAESAVVVGC